MSHEEWDRERRARGLHAIEYQGDEDAEPWNKIPEWERQVFLRRADSLRGSSES